jgi:D-alanyl-lipoteichoic acid acyltransferase DltB (MBOAT superfamily)
VVFSSIEFVVFFITVFIVYWLIPRENPLRLILLLVASYIFYAWGNLFRAGLLFALSLIDFFACNTMLIKPTRKKLVFSLAIMFNFAVWIGFKYLSYFASFISPELVARNSLSFFLFPVGLSFYALRKIAYLVEVYQGRLLHSVSFLNHGLYIAFFPQLLSGPIEAPGKLLSQFKKLPSFSWNLVNAAVPLLVMGLIKKIIIADNLRIIVDRIFNLRQPAIVLFFVGAFGFAFHLYADFSSYTDLSRTFALLLGFQTSENFNAPYLSISPTDFWNRWHITLSVWLRSYIFFPLRRWLLQQPGNHPWAADILPPLITMLCSGFWHGTGWNYLAWGFYYGLLIIVYQKFKWAESDISNHGLQRVAAVGLMFILTVFGWSLFRAGSITWWWTTLTSGLWGLSGDHWIAAISSLTMILVFSSPLLLKHLISRLSRGRQRWELIYYAAMLVILLVFINSGMQEFIYFKF